jgi:hypothetical protein
VCVCVWRSVERTTTETSTLVAGWLVNSPPAPPSTIPTITTTTTYLVLVQTHLLLLQVLQRKPETHCSLYLPRPAHTLKPHWLTRSLPNPISRSYQDGIILPTTTYIHPVPSLLSLLPTTYLPTYLPHRLQLLTSRFLLIAPISPSSLPTLVSHRHPLVPTLLPGLVFHRSLTTQQTIKATAGPVPVIPHTPRLDQGHIS